MSMKKKTLVLAVLAASTLASAPAMAELTGNVGAVSNYLWRGVTQTNEGAAVQGGIDYTSGGFYVGTWTSNIAWRPGYEADVYGGYKFDLSGVGLDVGVIDYAYPVKVTGKDSAFYEGYVGATYGNFSAKVSYSPDVTKVNDSTLKSESSVYVEAAYSVEVGNKSSLALHAGNYSGDGIKTVFGDTYSDFSVTLSKDAFSFGVTKTSGLKATGADDARVFVGYKTSLGL